MSILEFLDPITDSSNRLDLERSAYFFTEIFDMGIDRSIIEVLIVTDDIFHERLALDNSFIIFHEVFEESEFCFCELHLSSIHCRYMRFSIEIYISEVDSFSMDFLFLSSF